MGSLSNYLENELLDHVLNNAAYSPAATLYLALCTADPTDAGTGASMNEVANSGNYSRKAITVGAAAQRQPARGGRRRGDRAAIRCDVGRTSGSGSGVGCSCGVRANGYRYGDAGAGG